MICDLVAEAGVVAGVLDVEIAPLLRREQTHVRAGGRQHGKQQEHLHEGMRREKKMSSQTEEGKIKIWVTWTGWTQTRNNSVSSCLQGCNAA
jgi:hypothetical protein